MLSTPRLWNWPQTDADGENRLAAGRPAAIHCIVCVCPRLSAVDPRKTGASLDFPDEASGAAARNPFHRNVQR